VAAGGSFVSGADLVHRAEAATVTLHLTRTTSELVGESADDGRSSHASGSGRRGREATKDGCVSLQPSSAYCCAWKAPRFSGRGPSAGARVYGMRKDGIPDDLRRAKHAVRRQFLRSFSAAARNNSYAASQLNSQNVTAVGIGRKVTAGVATDEFAVRIYVRHRLSKRASADAGRSRLVSTASRRM
jgi:hypothetical protein